MMASSSTPSAVVPGIGRSLFATTESHFHDPSAWRLNMSIQLPLSLIGAVPSVLGVSLIAHLPLAIAVSPVTRTSSTGTWKSGLNTPFWASLIAFTAALPTATGKWLSA